MESNIGAYGTGELLHTPDFPLVLTHAGRVSAVPRVGSSPAPSLLSRGCRPPIAGVWQGKHLISSSGSFCGAENYGDKPFPYGTVSRSLGMLDKTSPRASVSPFCNRKTFLHFPGWCSEDCSIPPKRPHKHTPEITDFPLTKKNTVLGQLLEALH